MQVGSAGTHPHQHTWDGKSIFTSVDDGHYHTVSSPASGYTNVAGMDLHRHELPDRPQAA